MGGESFLEKLKTLLGGTSSSGTPPMGRTAPNEVPPWEVPISGGAPMPMASPSPEPPPAPSMQDDVDMQVKRLMRQRDIAKRLIPEQTWNR